MKLVHALFVTLAVLLSMPVSAEDLVWVWLTVPPDVSEQYKRHGEAEAITDIAMGALKIKGFGLSFPDENIDRLYFKYRLQSVSLGCIVDERQRIYVTAYNRTIDNELERRYGKNFWERFEAELSALRAAPNKPLPMARSKQRDSER